MNADHARDLYDGGELSEDAYAAINARITGYSVSGVLLDGRSTDSSGIYRSPGHVAALFAQLALSGVYRSLTLFGWRMSDYCHHTDPLAIQTWQIGVNDDHATIRDSSARNAPKGRN